MSRIAEPTLPLGPESAGILMTPEEFDAVEDYDEEYRYELIHGVLVVGPIPSPEETGPNELLGYHLFAYQRSHAQGANLDLTLPQQYVKVRGGRRLADRLIWAGLGNMPNPRKDLASIAVEFVCAGRRNRRRDHVEKRRQYHEARLKEYWIIDRFQRTMTVLQYRGKRTVVKVIAESGSYESPLLPGFEVPLAELLQAADRLARPGK
jgi:Uma2 family endonuclease